MRRKNEKRRFLQKHQREGCNNEDCPICSERREALEILREDLNLPETFDLSRYTSRFLTKLMALAVENDIRSTLAKDIGTLIKDDPIMHAVALLKLADVALEALAGARQTYE